MMASPRFLISVPSSPGVPLTTEIAITPAEGLMKHVFQDSQGFLILSSPPSPAPFHPAAACRPPLLNTRTSSVPDFKRHGFLSLSPLDEQLSDTAFSGTHSFYSRAYSLSFSQAPVYNPRIKLLSKLAFLFSVNFIL